MTKRQRNNAVSNALYHISVKKLIILIAGGAGTVAVLFLTVVQVFTPLFVETLKSPIRDMQSSVSDIKKSIKEVEKANADFRRDIYDIEKSRVAETEKLKAEVSRNTDRLYEIEDLVGGLSASDKMLWQKYDRIDFLCERLLKKEGRNDNE